MLALSGKQLLRGEREIPCRPATKHGGVWEWGTEERESWALCEGPSKMWVGYGVRGSRAASVLQSVLVGAAG